MKDLSEDSIILMLTIEKSRHTGNLWWFKTPSMYEATHNRYQWLWSSLSALIWNSNEILNEILSRQERVRSDWKNILYSSSFYWADYI